MRHASIALHPASCTSCMLCVRECPDWCITLEARTIEDESAPSYSNARRPATTKVLESFTIDFGACMWCGVCVDVCPFDALFWSTEPPVSVIAGIDDLAATLPSAHRQDRTPAPRLVDPPSGRRKSG